MKLGRFAENVWNRSVLKLLHSKHEDVYYGAAWGRDCAIFSCKKSSAAITATATCTGFHKQEPLIAMYRVMNQITAQGGVPFGILTVLTMPEKAREIRVKEVVGELNRICEKYHIENMGVNGQASKTVTDMVLTITAYGYIECEHTEKQHPIEEDVVATKWIALSGSNLLAKIKKETLLARYPEYLIEEALSYESLFPIADEAATAIKSGVSRTYSVGESGIFGALWDMAEYAGVGLDIDLKKIPVKQATIEICNELDINPYECMSDGCMLCMTKQGNQLVSMLEKKGIHAVVIGRTTAANDRVIRNGEECRFLEPAREDAVFKCL